MRSFDEVAEIKKLFDAGLNNCEVARETGIPLSTVRGWRHRRTERSRTAPADGCTKCGGRKHDFGALPSAAYAYLLGQYLGDGSITRTGRSMDLRIFCCDDYPEIMDEAARAIVAVLPGTKVGRVQRVGCTTVRSYSRQWPCLLPQHGPGRKHDREIRLTDW